MLHETVGILNTYMGPQFERDRGHLYYWALVNEHQIKAFENLDGSWDVEIQAPRCEPYTDEYVYKLFPGQEIRRKH